MRVPKIVLMASHPNESVTPESESTDTDKRAPDELHVDESDAAPVISTRSDRSTSPSMDPSPSVMDAMKSISMSNTALASMQESLRPTLSAMTALQQAAIPTSAFAAMQESLRPTLSAMTAQEGILGRSALRDWSEALDRTLSPSKSPRVRQRRRAAEFFAAFEAEVKTLPELLRALAVMQEKNSHLGLVWRGQQDATWAVDSSLTRRLRDDGHELGEEEMVAVERFQMGAADRWGIPRIAGELNYLAELQHEGVPTRLVDVSLDPEVAVWFAVQESVKFEDIDGRLFAWGRSAAPKRGHKVSPPTVIQTAGGDAFWQFWADQETRRTNEWGTGRAVPSWQPTALNERMRAQRAAFLFDAEPIIGPQLLGLFKERLDGDWRAGEIAEATRIVGFPSSHTHRAKPNSAGIVPMFTLRITAEAKREIRPYLEQKGLTEATIYPDRAGLISYLHRMSAR